MDNRQPVKIRNIGLALVWFVSESAQIFFFFFASLAAENLSFSSVGQDQYLVPAIKRKNPREFAFLSFIFLLLVLLTFDLIAFLCVYVYIFEDTPTFFFSFLANRILEGPSEVGLPKLDLKKDHRFLRAYIMLYLFHFSSFVRIKFG